MVTDEEAFPFGGTPPVVVVANATDPLVCPAFQVTDMETMGRPLAAVLEVPVMTPWTSVQLIRVCVVQEPDIVYV